MIASILDEHVAETIRAFQEDLDSELPTLRRRAKKGLAALEKGPKWIRVPDELAAPLEARYQRLLSR